MSIRIVACVAAVLLPALAGCESTASSKVDSTGLKDIVLTADGDYPCILQFEPTGVVIRPDPAGAHPDPGGLIVRQTDGVFYSSTPRGGQVLVWSEDGEFLRTIGTPGPGPGELGIGAYPMVDRQGTVHVFDQGRWTRYAPDGTFLSVTASPNFLNVSLRSPLVGPDTLLVVARNPEPAGQFLLLASDGGILSEFGGVPAPTPAPWQYSRNISPVRDDGFWAAPPHGTPEYLLEEWSVAGTLKRRIRRDVSWFTEVAGRDPDGTGGGTPLIISPFLGSGGHLIAMTTYIPLSGPGGDIWYEVIDPDNELVLASLKIPSGERAARFDLEPGTEVGLRPVRDDLGFVSYEILRYSLSPRDEGSRALCGR